MFNHLNSKRLLSALLFFSLVNIAFLFSQGTADPYENKEKYLKEVEKKRFFTFDMDLDNNNFPDTWFVQKGEGYQLYHSILIDNTNGTDDKKSLRFVFSGGKTSVYSSPLKLNQRFAYNLKLNFKTLNVGAQFNNELKFGLKTLDAKQKVIETFEFSIADFSKSNQNWETTPTLRIEKIPDNTHSCILFVELSGRPSGRSILWIDEVSIKSSPRIIFSTKAPLNIFQHDQILNYKATIEGTVEDTNYTYALNVKDFRGNIIDKEEEKFSGSTNSTIIDKFVDKAIGETGVYYINIKLLSKSVKLAEVTEIIARKIDSSVHANFEFGVLIGRPNAPFSRLTLALNTLGTRLGKLDILAKGFSFANWEKSKKSLPKLDPLLLKEAPDENFRFIGVIDKIPQEAITHKDFKVNPATHVSETFPPFDKEWKKTLEEILFKYGNVLTDWQIGKDNAPLSDQQIIEVDMITKYLTKKANWMKTFLPLGSTQQHSNIVTPNLFVPNSMTLEAMAKMLNPKSKRSPVTIELDSNLDTDRPTIIANLIKKITIAKSALNENNQPIANPIFIDSLTSENKGLMTVDFKPHSTYFAAKTIIEWMQNAKYIGSFFFENKDIVNYVFKKDNLAFTIIWHKNKKSTEKFYLGGQVSLMDLMGNRQNLNLAPDHSISVTIDQIPVILATTIPQLWESILSFKLENKDLSAAVKIQKQTFSIKNFFDNNAKFDIEVNYPSDWIVENQIFSGEIDKNRARSHSLKLSPSALSPLGNAIKVKSKLQISLPDSHHFARIYREDSLTSGIMPSMKFYKAKNGLQVDIHIETSKLISKPTSFIASALLPGGEVVEALFKDITPNKKSIQSGFIPKGLKYVGKKVELSVREHNGNRHILKTFPIQLAF
jgi:hypothetical protein